MNKKLLTVLAIAAALALAIYFGTHRSGGGGGDTSGGATPVEITLDNWKSEVTDQEAAKPVLIFFTNSAVAPEQAEVVKDFALKHGNVHVVIVNTDHRELLVLASKYDVDGYPSFRVLYNGKELKGEDGKFLDAAALQKLLDQAK